MNTYFIMTNDKATADQLQKDGFKFIQTLESYEGTTYVYLNDGTMKFDKKLDKKCVKTNTLFF